MVGLILWPLAEVRNVHILVQNYILKFWVVLFVCFFMVLCFHPSFRPKPKTTEVHNIDTWSCPSRHTSILSLVFVTLYLCQFHCGNPPVDSNAQLFFSPWVLQAQWGPYAGQGESKHKDKHNDKQLCVVNIITTSAMNDLLHAIFYTNGSLKNRRGEWTINQIIFLCSNRKANKV